MFRTQFLEPRSLLTPESARKSVDMDWFAAILGQASISRNWEMGKGIILSVVLPSN
jgi:hypothetical protein